VLDFPTNLPTYYSCPLCNILRSKEKLPPVWIAVDMLALLVCPNCMKELEEEEVPAPRQIGFSHGHGGGDNTVNAVAERYLEGSDD